ncbi:T-complex protein 1 subunit theta [Mitosporidium daphniae]
MAEEMGYCDLVETIEIGSDLCTIFKSGMESSFTKLLDSTSRIASIVLRGSTLNFLDDVERAIDDGVNVVKSLTKDGRLLPGAGATEMALSIYLQNMAVAIPGLTQYGIKKFGQALEAIPKILCENSGLDHLQILAQLSAAHEAGQRSIGVDVESLGQQNGTLDVLDAQIMDLYATKASALHLAVDAALSILRIDSIRKKNKRQRQASAVQSQEHTKNNSEGPSSFVVKLGSVQSPLLAELVLNFRTMMSPRTAINLVEKKTTKIKDYMAVCSQLNVTNCLFFSQTLFNSVLRMARFSQGPTLYFNIDSYSLMKDVFNSMPHPVSLGNAVSLSPLVIFDGFERENPESHLVLCETFLKNLFPPSNFSSHAQLSQAKRVLLFSYHPKQDQIQIRQYKIMVRDPESSIREILSKAEKNISEIIEAGKDLADFVLENIAAAKKDPTDQGVSAELKLSKKKKATRKLHLVETGPRLALTLFQVQEGFCSGKDIYLRDLRRTELNAGSNDNQMLENSDSDGVNGGRHTGNDEYDDEEEDDENAGIKKAFLIILADSSCCSFEDPQV